MAAAEGQHFSYLEVLSSLHDTCEAVYSGFSSMSQDVMNCRLTEVDAINGFVVRRAAAHNVPAPYNTFVVNLVHAIEDGYEGQEKPLVRYEDEVVVEQGDVCPCIYRVVQGAVTVVMNRGQEDEYFVGIYNEGKCFGEYSCLAGKPNPFSVVACKDSVVMEIPKGDIHNYLAMNPKNAEEMLTSLSNQIALMMKHIELLNGEIIQAV